MQVELGKPIDSTEELIKSGTEVYLSGGTFFAKVLLDSPNIWQQEAAKSAIFYDSVQEKFTVIQKILNGEKITLLHDTYSWAYKVKNDFNDAPHLHLVNEPIRPYYCAWAIQKASIWTDAINHHILVLDQVCYKMLSNFFTI